MAAGALRHRNFRLFLFGQVVSLVGTWMQNVAQSWLVYRLTRSEWLLGVTTFCGSIPVFLLAPLGGLAADRHSRHRIVVSTQALALLQALALAWLTLSGRVSVHQILLLALGLGLINAFDVPARQSLFIELTGRDDLLSAISLNSAIFNLARVIGPALAGFVVARLGEGLCFLLNAVSFLAVLAALLAMRLEPKGREARGRPLAELKEGFLYAHHTPALRTLMGMSGAVNFCGGAAMVLAPVFADGIFRRGSVGLGLLTGAMGMGALIGTVALSQRRRVEGLPGVIFSSAAVMAGGLALFAWSPSFPLSMALMVVVGFGVMRQLASANTLVQTIIRDEYRGRIMALYAMMVIGTMPLGSIAGGALAERVGARWTVFTGALLCGAAAAGFAVRLPVLKESLELRETR